MIRLRKSEAEKVLNGQSVALFRQLGHSEQRRLCRLSQGKPIQTSVVTGGKSGKKYIGTVVAVHDKQYRNGDCVYGVTITVLTLEETNGISERI